MRMRGHAGASGYDRLADFLDARVIHPVVRWRFHQRIICKSFKFLINHSRSQWYHRTQFYSELQGARQWFHQAEQIFHFLYGENSYRYLGTLKFTGRRNSIVCTFHTPPDKFRQVVQARNHLSSIDAVIVVSSSQMEFFSGLVGRERVFYVPHGIDVDFFRPRANKDHTCNGVRCLFVGRHLRDFETLARTAQLLERWSNNLRLLVVTSANVNGFFAGTNNIELYSGISDERLLEFYQQSDIFALPLLGCTANNSLLEAMASGLPIVSTDLPGVRDYTNPSCALLTPQGNPKALAEAILCLQEDKALRQKMAIASRARAQDFQWRRVASEVRRVYEQITG